MIGGKRRSMKLGGERGMVPGEEAAVVQQRIQEERRRKKKKPDPGEEFADIWAMAVIAQRHLRIATFALGGFVLLLLVIVVRLSTMPPPKPIVIRVDEVGRAEALAYEAVEANPAAEDPATKYFLNQFLHDHLSRERATIDIAWPRSLRFLETGLAQAAYEADADDVALFAAGGSSAPPERRLEQVVVVVQPSATPPWIATADYTLVTSTPTGVGEPTRERWTATAHFIFLDPVPMDLLPVNPLGLIVTYFAVDRAASF